MSPARRRAAASHLQRQGAVSERRSCRVIQQPRSTQRRVPKVRDDEAALIRALHRIVQRRPRFGYRRVRKELEREGFVVNLKRVYRLWRREGFKVPRRKRRPRRRGGPGAGVPFVRAAHRNHVWAWDFTYARDERGRAVKFLALIDEHTRECHLLHTARSIKAADAVELLSAAMGRHGAPAYLRSDNGPEFIARALRRFVAALGTRTLYIAPGKPWQNGFAESFHSRFKDELVETSSFADVREARALADGWREDYNQQRPHSSLGYRTPAAFAASQPVARPGATPHASLPAAA